MADQISGKRTLIIEPASQSFSESLGPEQRVGEVNKKTRSHEGGKGVVEDHRIPLFLMRVAYCMLVESFHRALHGTMDI